MRRGDYGFIHEDAKEAEKMLTALLPPEVMVYTGLFNSNRTLNIKLSNERGDAVGYEFGWVGRAEGFDGRPGALLTREALLDITEQWKSGGFVGKSYEPPVRQAPPSPYIATRDALVDWVAKARKGDTVVYFRGSVAHFRHDAPRRIVELQRRSDNVTGKRESPASERSELRRLQQSQELLAQINLFMRHDLITLSQRPDIEGNGTAYLAIRKGKNMAVSHPYEEGKLRKEIKNAIDLAWARFSKDFQVQAIDWEGSTDKTHETTAKVLVYRDNPQDPVIVYVPARDLGENRSQWPHILAAKAKKVVNMVNAREGRRRGKATSLNDERI